MNRDNIKRRIASEPVLDSQPTCWHCGELHYGSLPGRCPYICQVCKGDIRPDSPRPCECKKSPTTADVTLPSQTPKVEGGEGGELASPSQSNNSIPPVTQYLRHLTGCDIFEGGACVCGMLKAEGRICDLLQEQRESLQKLNELLEALKFASAYIAKAVADELMQDCVTKPATALRRIAAVIERAEGRSL